MVGSLSALAAKLGHRPQHGEQLLWAEKLLAGRKRLDLLGHPVDTAPVATIGQRDPQIVDPPLKLIAPSVHPGACACSTLAA